MVYLPRVDPSCQQQLSPARKAHPAFEVDDLDAIRRFAVASLRQEQDQDLQAFGVGFDVYFLESSLYADGKVDETVRELIAHGHTYEEGGALWLRTTAFGDDKDRVMRKSDGTYTYFLPDVAYHLSNSAPTTTARWRACAPACRRWTPVFPRVGRNTCCTRW